jgi:hypothetical protein
MQVLNFEEINQVSGGDDMQVVVVTGDRMTDAEKYEYDMQHSSGFWDSVGITFGYWMGSTDWRY